MSQQDQSDRSKESERELLSDRTKFKLRAAEYHLDQLKEIDKKYRNILIDRINAEIQIDCYFAQIIGAKDSLLVQINEKENLGLQLDEVNLKTLNTKLNNKKDILEELNRLSSDKESWYWLLNELRNHSIHRAMLNKNVSMHIIENVNENTSMSMKPVVSFLVNPLDKEKKPMDKPAIQYPEESLQSMKELIDRIRIKAAL